MMHSFARRGQALRGPLNVTILGRTENSQVFGTASPQITKRRAGVPLPKVVIFDILKSITDAASMLNILHERGLRIIFQLQ